MSKMDFHNEVMGRILAYLIEQGLSRVNFVPQQVPTILGGGDIKDAGLQRTFADVVQWMTDEGLVRVRAVSFDMSGAASFMGVQLTSRGIAVIQAKPDDPDLGESIEQKVTEKREGGLDAHTFTKIGSMVGGILGGFTKSIGS